MPTSSPSPPPLPAERHAQSYREHGPRQREPHDLATIAPLPARRPDGAGLGWWEEAGADGLKLPLVRACVRAELGVNNAERRPGRMAYSTI